MQLALLILLVGAFGSVLGWIGSSTLSNWAFALYSPVFCKSLDTQQRTLKREILRNKAELRATSSQDQFAKWAKLRRKLDKGLSDLEANNAKVAAQRAQFDRGFSTFLYVITSGLQWALIWWYRREPVFWIPAGWVPRNLDRWLCFGGGPRGSVSVTIWSIVCKKVAGNLAEVVIQWVPNPSGTRLSSSQENNLGKLVDTVAISGLDEKH
ncbi:GET complex subunit get1 [Naganishia albida]|nr:GET complex subunit get1 [Naganishia albida]